jgi:hypothetical protein
MEVSSTGKVDTGRPGAAQVSKQAYRFEDEDLNGVRIVGHGSGAPWLELSSGSTRTSDTDTQ